MRRPFAGSVRVDGRSGHGIDISMGGMRVSGVSPTPEAGRIVLVEFVLPGGGPMATRAEVRRVEDGALVLRFVRLDPSNLLKLAQFANREAA